MDYSHTKDIIKQTEILDADDMSYITGSIESIQANWLKRQKYRTETEMRISVLNDVAFPTSAAKYWQCVREQSGFYESLVQESFQYREELLKEKKIRRRMKTFVADELRLEGLQIKLERSQFTQLHILQTAKDRVRELRLWDTLMAECIADDPNFDTEDVNAHQLVSYAKHFELKFQNKGGTASPGELANIVGQRDTANRLMLERGEPKLTYSVQLHEAG